jgi:2-dehydropantoate 2-reductase
MAHIAIIGVGAIGGVTAALLAKTGRHRITLCTRRPLEQLTVKTSDGEIVVRAENITDPAMASAVDWVLVATKVYDSKGAAVWLPSLRGKDTPLVTLQNGVEQRETFSAYVNPGLIVPVIVDVPAERRDHGVIFQRGAMRMQMEDTVLGSALAGLLEGSGAEVSLTDDWLTAAWRKLCLNAAGAVCALVMKPAGVLQDKALGKVVLDIVAECVAVGKAEGALLDEGFGQQILDRFRAQPPDAVNSILADRLAGRPMEFDARNGVIVRKGQKHGIATPVNQMVVALLGEMGQGAA